MKLEDRNAIIDRIHKMRLQMYDSQCRADKEVTKPNLPTLHEKARLMEQYF